jgi:mRNA interferase MazF
MTDFSKYDIVVVKFPFASSLKYKARPAVIISSTAYNEIYRNTFIILAISSQVSSKLDIESDIVDWQYSGLLKPSIFKSSVATIDQDVILTKLGQLSPKDSQRLEEMLTSMC